MATKQIIELGAATSFDDGDLLLIRKTASGIDNKIPKANFLTSIGNPVVQGFVAANDGDNKLTLTSSTGKEVDKYYNGMKVSFVSPINSTGEVQIKIGNLIYKDIYKFGTTETILLTTDNYYEAVFIGDPTTGTFYWTNDYTSTDFVYTSGYRAASTAVNKIDLLPSSGFEVEEYYDGMTIAFVSPILSNGLVQVKINNLQYRDILIYNTTDTIDIEQNEYIEAIYIGDATTGKFYRTNDITQESTVYTNEYTATGVITGTTGPTALTLTSAIGTKKQRYYTGMSLLFTSPVNSKGNVTVNVDGLGAKDLNEGPSDKIPNDLNEGQAILAIFDGTQFIKHRFETVNPPLPELPPDEEDNIPPPPQYNINVTVGANGDYTTILEALNDLVEEYGEDGGNRKCTVTLKTGFIIKEQLYLKDGNYSWITINSESNEVTLDLTTIKIPFRNNTNSDTYAFLYANRTRCPTLQLKIVGSGSLIPAVDNGSQNYLSFIYLSDGSNLTLSESSISNIRAAHTIKLVNESKFNSINTTYSSFNKGGGSPNSYCFTILNSVLNVDGGAVVGGSFNNIIQDGEQETININNFNINGGRNQAIQTSSTCKSIILNNVNIDNYSLSGIGLGKGTKFNFTSVTCAVVNTSQGSDALVCGDGSQGTMKDCSFTGGPSSTTVATFHNSTINMENCNITSLYTGNNVYYTITSSGGNYTLLNCRVSCLPNNFVNNVYATGGSIFTLDGGNYTNSSGVTRIQDLVVYGGSDTATIRLKNNPIGGYTPSPRIIVI